MNLLVVGAGATGGYFGGRLAQAGRDVTFLVRPARAQQLHQNGLCIISPHGDMTLHPKIVTADAIAHPFDIILLTVKGFQLDAALEDVAPAVGPDTMIIPVLNGMRHMDILARRFSLHNLLGGVLMVATVLDDNAHILQIAPVQWLAYGELDGTVTPRLQALDTFMRGAEIGARISTDIGREMWEKWILLAALGAITCLMRGKIGEVEACPRGAVFALQLLDEVVTIVKTVGVPPSEAFLASARQQLTTKGSPFASSMYRDLQRGRTIEVENIIGDLLRHGDNAGVETPLLSTAYLHLLVYKNRIEKSAASPSDQPPPAHTEPISRVSHIHSRAS